MQLLAWTRREFAGLFLVPNGGAHRVRRGLFAHLVLWLSPLVVANLGYVLLADAIAPAWGRITALVALVACSALLLVVLVGRAVGYYYS